MPELQPVREVAGASPTERVDAAALEDAPVAAGAPHAGTGRRPLWASLLQPAGASPPDAGAGQPSEPAHAPSAPAPLPARTVAHALPGVQADRLLASLKGVALAAAAAAPTAPSAPTGPTGTGVAVGPAQGPSRPGEGATARTADLSSGAPSNPAHQKPPLAKTGLHAGPPKAGIPNNGAAKNGPLKGAPLKSAPLKRAEPNDAAGAPPGVPRDPSSDDILPSGRRKRFSFRLR